MSIGPIPECSMRLPTYRGSWQRRYHPYPRYELSLRERLEQDAEAVSHDDEDHLALPAYVPRLPPADEVDEVIDSLEVAVHPQGKTVYWQRPCLSTLVIDLAIFIILWRPAKNMWSGKQ
ncbi:hypothetical protein PUNSTDRAFT_117295 [Punctularia strigosozonata HHB-11173 SS5]|uniref:uncharacterized protein n=1 Tax=Punctularia strigosozonata (strain HHB-11173) TaxID=741275 RepID=UPI0004417008|nr:uncharacterized protein PUNSTDRAFT_117295 [Punctularia strigosozonata HHB-11173 SS5]EIN13556.1 hypothetical protein PUNSTDRAFT_117295 [Punctularia strigosozonata HHB-11173 SS5]